MAYRLQIQLKNFGSNDITEFNELEAFTQGIGQDIDDFRSHFSLFVKST